MQEKMQRLKFHDFKICRNILYVDADADAEGIAIALLHQSAGALKMLWGCKNYSICIVIRKQEINEDHMTE